ncbi:MAG: hypothetical protein A2W90_13195 [Bacteroidetes bacterium GWF2_42_66]|nr:MAG: hypothetical protein A2W92_19295 [Bacteroidetes bacterium GWA2_42_15]OFY00173.1 MAG: hypothetical protein A2W89_18185 [Bacteroidetes bacterium GWE2_42_39]OFY40315.1 MAG: hypothetical protein A2W90_13195 [Bacteroidetes bacterium GWF2_42_66]HBL73700.1 hypothetical protein [Prolixibacteraceae bacterium]HCR90710.1 hypothetical protein [Prolixibacteraceae bacterium]
MLKTILKIFLWLLLFGFLGFTVWFTTQELDRVSCQEVSVRIIEGSPRFLQEEDILELIKKTDRSIFGKKLNQINTEVLEEKLRTVENIRNVEVFRVISGKSLQFKGKLVFDVEQRNPVVRIKTNEFDYYLDKEGIKIPISDKFTVKVPVFSGTVTSEYATKELLPFAGFIYSDPFWKAQIEQVFVKENNELLVIPRVGDHLIEFGTPENFQEKLRNLKAVYQQGFSKTGWDKYTIISLKYKNQVVCTKS